jgi:hypothetical protein
VDENDEIIGETSDPEGRRVVLLDRIWRGKILGKHGEIGVFLEDVLRAVATPDHVEHDVRPDRTHCFARNLGPSKWLRVVVSYEEIPALIITAHGHRKDPRQWNAST